MNCGFCKHCVWWDKEAFSDSMGLCTLADEADKFEAYGDGVVGWLSTAPDFGCNQFESEA